MLYGSTFASKICCASDVVIGFFRHYDTQREPQDLWILSGEGSLKEKKRWDFDAERDATVVWSIPYPSMTVIRMKSLLLNSFLTTNLG